MVTWWRKEPVMLVVLVLVAVMVVQMILAGEVVTMDVITAILALLGGVAARKTVYSKHTTEDWLPEEWHEG